MDVKFYKLSTHKLPNSDQIQPPTNCVAGGVGLKRWNSCLIFFIFFFQTKMLKHKLRPFCTSVLQVSRWSRSFRQRSSKCKFCYKSLIRRKRRKKKGLEHVQ